MSLMHASRSRRFCNDNHRSSWDLLTGHLAERNTKGVDISIIVFGEDGGRFSLPITEYGVYKGSMLSSHGTNALSSGWLQILAHQEPTTVHMNLLQSTK